MKRKIQKLTLVQRLNAKSPEFFETLRTVGLCLAAAGGAVLSASVTLPAAIVTVAGYMSVAGSVMTPVSQAAVEGE
jgi:hypothetical protein